MPTIKVLVDPTVQSSDKTLEQVKTAANAANPNNAATVIRDVNGKVIAVDVHLPFDTAEGNLDTAHAAINANPGVAISQKFPLPVADPGDATLDNVPAGTDPVAAGVATSQDTNSGTMTTSTEQASTGANSLKVNLDDTVGSNCSFTHTQDGLTVVQQIQFGADVYIPAGPTGVEMVMSMGCAPAGNAAALVVTTGDPV